MPKTLAKEPFVLCFRRLPLARKIKDKRAGGIQIFRRKTFVSQCRKLSKGNLSVLCFRKNPVAKKIMYKMGGYIKIFRRSYLVSQCQKLSQLNLFVLCFRKLQVAEKIMDEKGGYQVFPSEKFCLTVPKSFVGEHFCAVFEKKSGSEKLYG